MSLLAATSPAKRWLTPDAAIRDATAASPLRCRGIDPAMMAHGSGGGPRAAQEVMHAHSLVLAVLAEMRREDERAWVAVVGCAHWMSWREIAAASDVPATTLRRLHRLWWAWARDRLVAHGLLTDTWRA